MIGANINDEIMEVLNNKETITLNAGGIVFDVFIRHDYCANDSYICAINDRHIRDGGSLRSRILYRKFGHQYIIDDLVSLVEKMTGQTAFELL